MLLNAIHPFFTPPNSLRDTRFAFNLRSGVEAWGQFNNSSRRHEFRNREKERRKKLRKKDDFKLRISILSSGMHKKFHCQCTAVGAVDYLHGFSLIIRLTCYHFIHTTFPWKNILEWRGERMTRARNFWNRVKRASRSNQFQFLISQLPDRNDKVAPADLRPGTRGGINAVIEWCDENGGRRRVSKSIV